MNPFTRASATVAAIALTSAALATTPANAQQPINDRFYSNATNTVRCYISTEGGKTTPCASAKSAATTSRYATHHRNSSRALESNRTGWAPPAGTRASAWNQPRSSRSRFIATVAPLSSPAFSGDLYAFDITKLALIRAGKANSVIFSFG